MQTLYRRSDNYGGTEVADARRLKDLESENAKLKRLVA
jgi:putative transposase